MMFARHTLAKEKEERVVVTGKGMSAAMTATSWDGLGWTDVYVPLTTKHLDLYRCAEIKKIIIIFFANRHLVHLHNFDQSSTQTILAFTSRVSRQ
jgi:hypothetical protein